MTPAGPARPAPPNRRTFALFVLGVVAFTAYGSLVPFEFRPLPWDRAVEAFRWGMANRLRPERADGLANFMLGVPLGFGLLGLACVDRCGRGRAVLCGLLLWPACVGVAAAVEFAQVYVPSRTCAGSDVLCQGAGSAAGMAGWVLAGRRLTGHARVVWGGDGAGGAAGRLLAGYLVLLAFVQFLPMDLSASPWDLGKKLRDQAVSVPFGEFHGFTGRPYWVRLAERVGAPGKPQREPKRTPEFLMKAAAKELQVLGLYVPVGLLAAARGGRFWGRAWRVAGAALVLAFGLEALQLLVRSRIPSATDVVVGAVGVLTGWAVGRWFKGRLRLEAALLLGQVWLAVLLAAYWDPFAFRGPPADFDWMPGLPLESGNPLNALEEFITKAVLFAPLGVLVTACSRGTGAWRFVLGAGLGLAASAVIEVGQLYLPSHTPCITDVLIGGVGGFAGAWLAARAGGGDGGAENSRPGVY